MVSLKIDFITAEKIKAKYLPYQEENNGEYIYFFARYNQNQLTIYEGKNNRYTAFFNGPESLKMAKEFDPNAEEIKPKEKIKTEWINLDEQIGSDEVGVGDFLLPMIVVAAYVNKEDITKLKALGVDDSKKLDDEFIMGIGPTLIKEFSFSKLTLSNEKYNEMILKGENINTLKAKMHNQALLNMSKKHKANNIFVDQFVKESTYYRYLENEKEIQKGVTFKTKGESYFPSVALASNIARYAFLIYKKNLEEKYQMTFPLGANKKVDEFALEFINKYGQKEFDKIVKKDFANYEEITKKPA